MNSRATALAGFIVLSCSMAAPIIASAGNSDYVAKDVIKHFATSVNHGSARGICVGTAHECAKARLETRAKAFDLLITFNKNSESLTRRAQNNLSEFARALKDPRLARAVFSIEGHTDASGSDKYNLALSKRRANVVRQFLLKLGVRPTKLTARGFGEFSPRTNNALDKANRRIEARIKLN